MRKPLRAIVVGLGPMGRRHVRAYMDVASVELASVELVGVVDRHRERAQQVGAELGIVAFADLDAALASLQPDVVTVATAPHQHAEVAHLAAGNGAHILVEKPLAPTMPAALEISNLAASKIVVAAGHSERHRASTSEFLRRVTNNEIGEIRIIRTRRTGPPPAHDHKIGASLDLAIHDLDIVRALIGDSEVVAISGSPKIPHGGKYEESLEGCLTFASGAIAEIQVDRTCSVRNRIVEVVGSDGCLRLDLLADTIETGTQVGRHPAGVAWNSPESVGGPDAIESEIADFLRAVRLGTAPLVTGHDGAQAVRLALALVER